jgi:RsiW-degrading membrane proteinase PrsW (M82 family)
MECGPEFEGSTRMVDAIFLSTFWDVIWATFIVFFVFMPLIMLWAYALVDLFMRRDIRWEKVLWLVVIVFIPIFGSLIYLLVRPDPYEEAAGGAQDA